MKVCAKNGGICDIEVVRIPSALLGEESNPHQIEI